MDDLGATCPTAAVAAAAGGNGVQTLGDLLFETCELFVGLFLGDVPGFDPFGDLGFYLVGERSHDSVQFDTLDSGDFGRGIAGGELLTQFLLGQAEEIAQDGAPDSKPRTPCLIPK